MSVSDTTHTHGMMRERTAILYGITLWIIGFLTGVLVMLSFLS